MLKNADNSKNFSIYYLNLSKVYEIAMTINNTIVSSVERSRSYRIEKEHDESLGLGVNCSFDFLSNIKASMSSERKTIASSSSGVVEKMEVKTTKSVLLRNVIDRCSLFESIDSIKEGDLIKIDGIELELLDEELAKQILILRRNALEGLNVEGIEINNLFESILQDYAYILRGKTGDGLEFILKIPTDIKSEFESKYSVNDLMIGHVSIIGIYKGEVSEESIKANMLNSFNLSSSDIYESKGSSRIIKSNVESESLVKPQANDKMVYYIDTLAIVQDLSFRMDPPIEKNLHWWNKLGQWLSTLGRKE